MLPNTVNLVTPKSNLLNLMAVYQTLSVCFSVGPLSEFLDTALSEFLSFFVSVLGLITQPP